jgi:hypothetical protein
MVDLDVPRPCVVQMRWKERTRFGGSIGRPVFGGEDEPVVLPGAAEFGAVGGLGLSSEVEHRLCDRQQREIPAACCGLTG